MQQENKMGVMPVNRLILTMSLPMILSMLVQALYNIVDSMFVSRLSENALTAVSLAFPAQNLMIAVATGTGVGVNAALSRSLGHQKVIYAVELRPRGLFSDRQLCGLRRAGTILFPAVLPLADRHRRDR